MQADSGAKLATRTVSTAAFRQGTGESKRARRAREALRKRRLRDAAFRAAEAALLATPQGVSGSVAFTTAQQVRLAAFPSMFAAYGSNSAARTRLLNYQGRRRELAKLANSLVDGNRVILVGDAKFSSNFGGYNGTVSQNLLWLPCCALV